ncbi:MAG TPA: hypothetical protein VKT53_17695 [Candidatus Acidoferrum sp.]|nr:hypothetical protein [Candidatus Acidoferrum sp.]
MSATGQKRKSAMVIALCIAWSSFAAMQAAAQAKPKMITGRVYRIHAGFLEVQSDPKNVTIVKVNAATAYWNGKADKKASMKELQAGEEVIIEATEKDGLATAQKVRFMPAEK